MVFTKKEFNRLKEIVSPLKSKSIYLDKTKEQKPWMELPKELFRFKKNLRYRAEFSFLKANNEKALFMRVLSHDPKIRETINLDFCLMAGTGNFNEDLVESLWPSGGAWCDEKEEFVIRFESVKKKWFERILKSGAFILRQSGFSMGAVVHFDKFSAKEIENWIKE